MDRRDFLALDDAHYSRIQRYRDDIHTMRGLFPWEEAAMAGHFPASGRLLVLAAGGGRESYALERRGFVVEGYECNPALVAYANEFRTRVGMESTVRLMARDEVPATSGRFDGAIVGWSGYMLIAGRDRRVALLRALRLRLDEGSPILISFFTREPATPRFTTISSVANVLRRLRGQSPIEMGDDLSPNFVHRFTEQEIRSELADGGFTTTAYAPQGAGPFDSGFAVGSATTAPAPSHRSGRG
jgi:hypothetical protein